MRMIEMMGGDVSRRLSPTEIARLPMIKHIIIDAEQQQSCEFVLF
jgi:hypothetical protein